MWFTTFPGVRTTNSTDWAFAQWIIAGAVTVALATGIMNIFRKNDGASTRDAKLRSSLTQVNGSVWRFYKPEGKHDLDIIFFHGLQKSDYEDAFWKTWLAKGDDQIIWPKDWLSKHLPSARILSVSYNSSASRMKGDDIQGDISTIGANLVQEIILDAKNDIGQNCPVFLVGHCLGGIIIKKFLLEAVKEKSEMNIQLQSRKIDRIAQFLDNFKGAFFYGVPSGGFQKTSFDELTSQLKGQSPILKLLTTLDTQRGRINEQFRQLRRNWTVRTFGLAESHETTYSGFTGVVVPEASIRQDVDTFYTHMVADHFTICKATDVNDFSVIGKLTGFITDPDIGATIQHTADLNEVL